MGLALPGLPRSGDFGGVMTSVHWLYVPCVALTLAVHERRDAGRVVRDPVAGGVASTLVGDEPEGDDL